DGISLFSSTGDAVGAATVRNGRVTVRFSSPNGTFGLANEYPILTIAVRISPNAVPGQEFPVILDPKASIWRDILGAAIPFEFHQGSVTVDGSVSIDDVVPGGGVVPAGVPFSVIGTGFGPETRIQLNGVLGYRAEYAGGSEFKVTLNENRVLDGTQIRARN